MQVAQSIALVLLTSLALAAPATATDRGIQRSADLDTLLFELERRHANAFHTTSRTAFVAKLEEVRARSRESSDLGFALDVARLTALIGDGHTGVFLPWDRNLKLARIPLELVTAKEGLLVIAAPQEHGALVGGVVTAIDGMPIDRAIAALGPLIPRENEHGLAALLPSYITLPAVLHELGVASRADRLTVSVLKESERLAAVMAAVPDTPAALTSGGVRVPRSYEKRHEPYWFEAMSADVLYVQYNDASIDRKDEPPAAFARKVFDWITKSATQRVIVDLRWNDGGSVRRMQPLLHALIAARMQRPELRTFVVTSPQTFSAAALFAVDLERHLAPVFAGEPPAGRPNAYGEVRRFRLPHSGIEVRYSAWFYQRSDPNDRRSALVPQLSAPMTAAAFRAGRDPAVEAIAAYRDPVSLADALRPMLGSDGAEEAVTEYRRIMREEPERYDRSPAQLNRLVEELVEKKRGLDALALADENVRVHPESARAHFARALALEAIGSSDHALSAYEKAFALDRSLTSALDAVDRLRRSVKE